MTKESRYNLGKKCIDCGKLIVNRATRCQKCYRKQSSWSKTGRSFDN